ncbi:hypothetical protein D8X55_04890 [Malacoplasma penetrans]|uniref:Uncharacterized protein n=1 Tax=Malacoplasma penetrans (strain HF-2) TaxID=272633 RepID=Q8EUH5_MALP2|nr:hypothetical protein [Malacoplasma penetrans]RXY96044.1 hypothetical protein D8X55_04890 [Malacoplasma penetrans]BAC44738.1 hypothetical protein [Malacoplasma penetrans HF-2]
MKNIFKNLFNNSNNKEKAQPNKTFESNSLINQKQKSEFVRNQNNEYDNMKMLNDLSLNEKNYLERELDFKYDCTDYKLLEIIRTDHNSFEATCEIMVDGQKQIVKEKILYEDIKDKNEEL